jgi:hypothetical protein
MIDKYDKLFYDDKKNRRHRRRTLAQKDKKEFDKWFGIRYPDRVKRLRRRYGRDDYSEQDFFRFFDNRWHRDAFSSMGCITSLPKDC